MAEAEDLLTDVARHATVCVRDLWRRHHPRSAVPRLTLDTAAARLDLVIRGIFGQGFPLRIAQLPARPTLLERAFGRRSSPWRTQPVPATDGQQIWLPAASPVTSDDFSMRRYRVVALQQAMRASRGSASLASISEPVTNALYLLLEAQASDIALIQRVPGLKDDLTVLRREMLQHRPDIRLFNASRRSLEELLRIMLAGPCDAAAGLPYTASPAESLVYAHELAAQWPPVRRGERDLLLADWWTGELRVGSATAASSSEATLPDCSQDENVSRSARLTRRPEVRQPLPDEEQDQEQGAWMMAADQPHYHAEDPFGMQRPIDRDEKIAAEEFGDLVSELPEAQLVSSPGRAPEILLSDDPPATSTWIVTPQVSSADASWRYPEWDYRCQAYDRSARVLELAAQPGTQQWVDDMLRLHAPQIDEVRRQFALLRAVRTRLYRRLDGDEPDLAAVTESYADFRAGLSRSERIYQCERSARHSLAVSLLIDISGSTDGWISAHRRVIDVEREALLLVSCALDALGEPYAITGFSGRGPEAVTAHLVKGFAEPYSNAVALRIAALEPQYFTRAGAAIRHATAQLTTQPAEHCLLLLLSDGKPHDIDIYDGRYGVEDVRQAVVEAQLQHVHPFCLTIDRQATDYLPYMFGASRYALLKEPATLPAVLVDWIRRLLIR
ncbi:MAG: hypothetical protein RBS88_08930 [Spongiibacteraceae bacterium]|nr:hypothetical protein [Spongiibacteraceae bacterium]